MEVRSVSASTMASPTTRHGDAGRLVDESLEIPGHVRKLVEDSLQTTFGGVVEGHPPVRQILAVGAEQGHGLWLVEERTKCPGNPRRGVAYRLATRICSTKPLPRQGSRRAHTRPRDRELGEQRNQVCRRRSQVHLSAGKLDRLGHMLGPSLVGLLVALHALHALRPEHGQFRMS